MLYLPGWLQLHNFLSIYVFVYLSVCPSVCLSGVCLIGHLSTVSTLLSIYICTHMYSTLVHISLMVLYSGSAGVAVCDVQSRASAVLPQVQQDGPPPPQPQLTTQESEDDIATNHKFILTTHKIESLCE